MPDSGKETGNQHLWRAIFESGNPDLRKDRRLHKALSGSPRCRLCLAPFRGVAGLIMKWRGRAPAERNPQYCTVCDGIFDSYPGGAEVKMSVLFIDQRATTEFIARSSRDQRSRAASFPDTVAGIIHNHDGLLMAFEGDCIVAVWSPGLVRERHASRALSAAKAVVRAQTDAVPIGVGVHCGEIFIGTVPARRTGVRDLSIFGPEVTVAARLAARAETGTALATDTLLKAAHQTPTQLETVTLRGVPKLIHAQVIR